MWIGSKPLVATLVAFVASCASAHAPSYRLNRQFAQRVTATLSKTIIIPNTASGTFKMLAFLPPETETQHVRSSSIWCREFPNAEQITAGDRNDRARSYIGVRVPLSADTKNRPLHFDIVYTLDLYRTSLRLGVPPDNPAVPSNYDQQASRTVDYEDPKFQAYLSTNDLKRREGEANLDFAYRAFRTLSRELASRTVDGTPGVAPANWHASFLCQPTCKDPGCGMCAIQMAAVLRANRVPARLLVGRWALNQEGDYGQYHVRVDFFDPQIGWVPLDPTFGMGACRNNTNPDTYFGGTDGNFITMHLNSEVAPEGTNFAMPIHQFEIVAYEGKERFDCKISETWSVRKE